MVVKSGFSPLFTRGRRRGRNAKKRARAFLCTQFVVEQNNTKRLANERGSRESSVGFLFLFYTCFLFFLIYRVASRFRFLFAWPRDFAFSSVPREVTITLGVRRLLLPAGAQKTASLPVIAPLSVSLLLAPLSVSLFCFFFVGASLHFWSLRGGTEGRETLARRGNIYLLRERER